MNRRTFLRRSALAAAAVGVTACAIQPPSAVNPGAGNRSTNASNEPIVIGVSGPLTGPNAQYGAAWKKGFDLAIEEINAKGGVRGRKLAYEFEDTQADPKQTVIVAQKFVADSRIVIELGDFSSTASMAASSIYQRAGLVQFGFTNSNPKFTEGGDFMWSSSVTQKTAVPALADFVKTLGLNKVAVMHLNTDWGKASHELFVAHAQQIGLDVVSAEGYAPDEKNFADTLTRVREAKPDGMVLFSYQTDGAQIAQQMAKLGLKLPIVAGASLQSPQFVELAGKAAEGTYIKGEFFPEDPRPEVQTFVKAYQAKYNEEPEFFAAHAYDALRFVAAAIEQAGPDRAAIKNVLDKVSITSVIYGTLKLDSTSRRPPEPGYVNLIVKDGKFVVWKQ
jgi:branched-chain amino acid transport system substrate-binding protein